MKKLAIAIVFALSLAAALCLAGCGGSSPASTSGASASSASASSSSEDAAKAEYDRACALFDEGKYYSAKVAFENSKYDDWEKRAAECVQPMPQTGELMHDESMVSDKMELEIVVNEENGELGRYFAVYTADHVLAETLFIKGAGTIETMLPGGNYYIKDASGTEWYGEKELFGKDGHYESMVFNEVEGDPYLTVLGEGYVWTITINNAAVDGQGVDSEQDDWESWS